MVLLGSVLVACGGSTVAPSTAGPKEEPPCFDCEGETSTTGSTTGSTAVNDHDELPSADDECAVLHPGAAKALPDGLKVPANAVGLRMDFELENQRIELVEMMDRGVAPAWTTKETQIFDPQSTGGSWVETRSAEGDLTYQSSLYDPLGRTLEAAPGPNGEGWKNSERCTSEAFFHVEIPGDAVEVRVYGQERSDRPTKLLAWYRLR